VAALTLCHAETQLIKAHLDEKDGDAKLRRDHHEDLHLVGLECSLAVLCSGGATSDNRDEMRRWDMLLTYDHMII